MSPTRPIPSMSARVRRAVARALAAGAIAALAACTRDAPAPATAPAAVVAAPVPTAIDAIDATLQIADNNGALRYDGIVGDAATRDALQLAITAAFGARASGTLDVRPGARPAAWAHSLHAFLPAFDVPGAMLRFEGERIALAGMVGDADRKRLRDAARAAFPAAALTGLFEGVDEAVATIPPGTQALLARLADDAIAFEPDSAVVDPASLDAIARAASAIRGSAVEVVTVGVRPELSDMPDYDRELADARATAVKNQLVVAGVPPARIRLEVLDVPTRRGDGGTVEFAVR